MADTYTKRCSSALAIREMQIKTMMEHHLTLVRAAITNKTSKTCWGGWGAKEPSFAASGNVNW